jgi:hypothetical protein
MQLCCRGGELRFGAKQEEGALEAPRNAAQTVFGKVSAVEDLVAHPQLTAVSMPVKGGRADAPALPRDWPGILQSIRPHRHWMPTVPACAKSFQPAQLARGTELEWLPVVEWCQRLQAQWAGQQLQGRRSPWAGVQLQGPPWRRAGQ